MDEKLYSKMQWPEIEALVYSEHDRPKQILGQHLTPDGLLIAAFIGDAKAVTVKDTKSGQLYPMVQVDEGGYFAVLLPEKTEEISYTYIVDFGENNIAQMGDPYAFESMITPDDIKKFEAGIHYEIYNVLGAHVKKINGIRGVHLRCGHQWRCGSALWGISATGTDGGIPCSAWGIQAFMSCLFLVFVPEKNINMKSKSKAAALF